MIFFLPTHTVDLQTRLLWAPAVEVNSLLLLSLSLSLSLAFSLTLPPSLSLSLSLSLRHTIYPPTHHPWCLKRQSAYLYHFVSFHAFHFLYNSMIPSCPITTHTSATIAIANYYHYHYHYYYYYYYYPVYYCIHCPIDSKEANGRGWPRSSPARVSRRLRIGGSDGVAQTGKGQVKRQRQPLVCYGARHPVCM